MGRTAHYLVQVRYHYSPWWRTVAREDTERDACCEANRLDARTSGDWVTCKKTYDDVRVTLRGALVYDPHAAAEHV